MRLSTLDKSLQVIEFLTKRPHGLSLAEISSGLQWPKSTVHHILSTLLPYGYVSQDQETRKYGLGFKFLSVSKIILDNIDVRKIAGRHLRWLHQACGEAVHLAVLRNGSVVYIDKIDRADGLSLATYVGFATEPHAAAGGKVLLADLSAAEIKSIYGQEPLKTFGKKTITSLEELFQELEKIRNQGFAVDDEEYYEGVRCVAAPVRAGSKVMAAVSVTGSIFTMTRERIDQEVIGLVKTAAGKISAEMQW